MAGGVRIKLRPVAARRAAMIRVDTLWLSVDALDMRAGMESILARVVQVFGTTQPRHAYLDSTDCTWAQELAICRQLARQSARLNCHEPFALPKDVLERLQTQPYTKIGELLPHRWLPHVCA